MINWPQEVRVADVDYVFEDNDERFSALDPEFEDACWDASNEVQLPDWAQPRVGRSLTHLILQPESCPAPF